MGCVGVTLAVVLLLTQQVANINAWDFIFVA
jgi:hypothetical protein